MNNIRRILNLLLLPVLALAAIALYGQSANLRPPNIYHTTLLTLRYTGGTIYQGATATTIATGTLSLTASKSSCTSPAFSSCNIIYWPGSGTALLTTATPSTAFSAGNVIVGTATTDGTTLLSLVTFDDGGWGNAKSNFLSDGYFFVQPGACGVKPTTTAFAAGNPKMLTAATGNLVLNITTDTTAGTLDVTCDLAIPGRTSAGKGYLITGVDLLYGVQTTNLSSIAAATVNTVTYPAVGGSGAGTVASAGGTLTILPASLQLTQTTSGQCFREGITFATPVMAVDPAVLTLNQVFTTAGTSATTLQICGAILHYFNVPI